MKSRKRWSGWAQAGAAILLTLMAGFCTLPVHAKDSRRATDTTVSLSQLPTEGQVVMALIYKGGPFRYDKDGTVFGNREKLLPAQPRPYYREYTVRTPGERSRGARRIVCGGQKPAAPDACYYTDDHYASFRQIVP